MKIEGANTSSSMVVPTRDSLRDTIESIVIAFIFAFVFRAFIVEAFIIPTGSMAPTLYGQHDQHRCPCCRYAFAYGLREDWLASNPQQPSQPNHRARCPNCGYEAEGNEVRHVDPAAAESGDRILVLKWPFDLGIKALGPHRWDVVVFKDPQNGEMNFIKRLLGLPGEALEIINGDLYAAPIASLSPALREALSRPRTKPEKPLDPTLRKELDSKLRIQRKTEVAQSSLWILHYDHDYPPNTSPEFQSRVRPPVWLPKLGAAGEASPWDASTPCVAFRPTDDSPHAIQLGGKPIRDVYGYNLLENDRTNEGDNPVGDLRLAFVLIPKADRGSVTVSLGKGPDRFDCTIDAGGRVALSRVTQGGFPREIKSATITPLRADRAVRVTFENVDFRVALRIDDEEVLTTADADYVPNVAKARMGGDGADNAASVEIGAKSLSLDLRHLTVYRDVFYRSPSLQYERVRGQPPPPVPPEFGDGEGWGTCNHPVLLRESPGDYFCCGDNSPQSKDSRLWYEVAPFLKNEDRVRTLGEYRYGTVPADQMIGRAFFVYWPSGNRLTERSIGFIPNVGRMRFIR